MNTPFPEGASLLKSSLPPRIERSNKGTYGKVLLLAGSYGMAGAACLAGGEDCSGPDLILLPEVPFDEEAFLRKGLARRHKTGRNCENSRCSKQNKFRFAEPIIPCCEIIHNNDGC